MNADQIRREFDGQLKSVKEFLTWQANDVKPFNDGLRNNAMQAMGNAEISLVVPECRKFTGIPNQRIKVPTGEFKQATWCV